jgi:hypothetical protein
MESLVILVIAAGLSAAVVWRALAPGGGRPRPKASPPVTVLDPPPDLPAELEPDHFVLLPTEGGAWSDDRPAPALSLIRLVLTIAFVAALGVVVLALLGWLVKIQLDHYFSRLGG